MGKKVEEIVRGAGMFQTFIILLVEMVKELGGTMENIYRLTTPAGKETLQQIAQIIVGAGEAVVSPILRLISAGQKLAVDACDGTETLADASDVFDIIDPDFRNWGADEQGPATVATGVAVYEMDKDATFSQMFGSLSGDVRELCLTQAQIKGFVKKYRQWLRTDGFATFFLFQSRDQLFVAYVSVRSDGRLKVHVYRFERSFVWSAGLRRRLVVPQLA